MKKLLIMILALSMALAFAGCGGGDSSKEEPKEEPKEEAKVYMDLFTADVPEGFTWDEDGKEFKRDHPDGGGIEQIIKVSTNYETAQEELDGSIAFWNDDEHTAGEDVTYGDYTWKVENFIWNGDLPSLSLYTDAKERPDESIEVTCFCIDFSDPALEDFLKSLKIVEEKEEE